jgi:hypothetical protein
MYTSSFRDTSLGILGGFVGLIQAISNWRAGTVTEANYTGYGTRPAITFGAAADTSPTGGRQRANSAAVTFPQNTGGNQDQIAFGIYSLATGGVLQAIGLLDSDSPIFGTTQGTSDTIEATAHGLQAEQRVFVLAAPGAVIPTGLSENVAYYVTTTALAADTFQLSTTTPAGTAVNITVGGCALFIPYKPVTVATNATPEFAIGSLIAQM